MNNGLLYDWLFLVTGYNSQKIIRANQNGPRPSESFVTWQIISLQPADYSRIDNIQNGYSLEVTDTRRYIVGVDVNVYGPDGLTILPKLTQSNTDPEVQAIFTSNGTTLIGAGVIQDLTGLGDTTFEPRYRAEFTFYSFIETSRIQSDYVWDDYSISGTLDGDTITIKP